MTENATKVMATEVLELLKFCSSEEYSKIPSKLIEVLNNNKIENYSVNIDLNKEIDEQNISKEAKILMFIIWRKYWCSEEEGKEFDTVLEENQKELEEKYSSKNLFQKNDNLNKVTENVSSNVQMIEYKENVFQKVLNWFKNIMKK